MKNFFQNIGKKINNVQNKKYEQEAELYEQQLQSYQQLAENTLLEEFEINPTKTKKSDYNFPTKPRNNDDAMFIVNSDGDLYMYSIKSKKVVYKLAKIKKSDIEEIASTHDKKTLYICNKACCLYEFDIRSRKITETFLNNERIDKMIVTHDNQILFTKSRRTDNVIKWCRKTKKKLYILSNFNNQKLCSWACTFNSRFLQLGYTNGYFAIFSISENLVVKDVQALCDTVSIPYDNIFSIVAAKDNKYVYLIDRAGYMRALKWKLGYFNKTSYEFANYFASQISYPTINLIYLVNDDKNLLLVNQELGILTIYNLYLKKLTNTFNLEKKIVSISQFKNGKSVIVIQKFGFLKVIDLETMQITDHSRPKDIIKINLKESVSEKSLLIKENVILVV